MDGDREALLRALQQAAHELGPHSEAHCGQPAIQDRLIERCLAGASAMDAVLAEVHRAAGTHPRIADEFIRNLLPDLAAAATSKLSPELRLHLEAGDLLHSVFGDVWSQFQSTRFTTRAAFLAFLVMRLRWKAMDRAGSATFRRMVPTDLEAPGGLAPLDTQTKGPVTVVIEHEELRRLLFVMLRLENRDRVVLVKVFGGETTESIAASLGITDGAARHAIQRARERAQRLLRSDDSAGGRPRS